MKNIFKIGSVAILALALSTAVVSAQGHGGHGGEGFHGGEHFGENHGGTGFRGYGYGYGLGYYPDDNCYRHEYTYGPYSRCEYGY